MKRIRAWALRSALVLGLFAPLPGAAAELSLGLSSSEEHLAGQIGFEKDILLLVKEVAQSPLHRLSGYDEDEYQIMANGIVVAVPWSRSDQVLWSLREKLRPRNYMAFQIEINNALKIDKICVIKGKDQYEILRIMHTNGDDNVSHEDVIAKLKQWEKRILQAPLKIHFPALDNKSAV